MSEFLEQTTENLVERAATTHYGKYRGIVTDIDDPENRCRIRATLEDVLDGQECGWAEPAAPFAGDGHGFVMLPEKGAGVWIEFAAGRLDDPIWSGGWWANDQRPNPQGPGVRTIVSKSGHKLVLDDDANEVTVAHGDGPTIKLTSDEITITVGPCEIKVGMGSISLNNGLIKVGLAGVSLVNGAMSFGVPPT